MHDQFAPGAGGTFKVREDTRGQVHRVALENAGIVFLASEQGQGETLIRNPGGARCMAPWQVRTE